MQIKHTGRNSEEYVPYLSSGGRSLPAELRTAPPPGSQARWSQLPDGSRDGRPVSDDELALLFETRRRLVSARVRRILRWLNQVEIVEDAVTMAFLEAVRRRPDRRLMPLAWITTVAYRRAITLAQRNVRENPEQFAVSELAQEQPGHGHATQPELWLEATELLRAVAKLPDRQRQVIGLTAAGFTHEEAAERIGGTVRGIENTARLARRKLRGQLAAEPAGTRPGCLTRTEPGYLTVGRRTLTASLLEAFVPRCWWDHFRVKVWVHRLKLPAVEASQMSSTRTSASAGAPAAWLPPSGRRLMRSLARPSEAGQFARELTRAVAKRGRLDPVYQTLSDQWTLILQRLFPVWCLLGRGLADPHRTRVAPRLPRLRRTARQPRADHRRRR